RIQAKKAGIERIILDGVNGEKKYYFIYAENPKLERKALKVNDIVTISEDTYISGTEYLQPVTVESKKPAVATISQDNSINVLANGSSKITVYYPGRKIGTSLTAKLPTFSSKKYTLNNRPKKLKMKNIKTGQPVAYSSSDENIVKVNSEGFIAPVANGSATVTGKTGKVVVSCDVTVKGLR
ncbi:MAG: hypothetical protein K6F99_07465, partial [Lachnospiraceae bacterium]|nr:hypothetical protein [Lachnospiraceae bacterium]